MQDLPQQMQRRFGPRLAIVGAPEHWTDGYLKIMGKSMEKPQIPLLSAEEIPVLMLPRLANTCKQDLTTSLGTPSGCLIPACSSGLAASDPMFAAFFAPTEE